MLPRVVDTLLYAAQADVTNITTGCKDSGVILCESMDVSATLMKEDGEFTSSCSD